MTRSIDPPGPNYGSGLIFLQTFSAHPETFLAFYKVPAVPYNEIAMILSTGRDSSAKTDFRNGI